MGPLTPSHEDESPAVRLVQTMFELGMEPRGHAAQDGTRE